MRAMRLAIFVAVLACASIVAAKPKQGEPCPAGKCAKGLTCIKYRGFAGAAGPELSSCEVRCSKAGKCAKGQSCVTIADGPGQVCRPEEKPAAAPATGSGTSTTGTGTGADQKPPAPTPPAATGTEKKPDSYKPTP
jgi:hypothetical protein